MPAELRLPDERIAADDESVAGRARYEEIVAGQEDVADGDFARAQGAEKSGKRIFATQRETRFGERIGCRAGEKQVCL